VLLRSNVFEVAFLSYTQAAAAAAGGGRDDEDASLRRSCPTIILIVAHGARNIDNVSYGVPSIEQYSELSRKAFAQ